MNYRLTITAAVAVILASFSLITVIQGVGWLSAGAGAVIVVVAAGVATRLATIPAAAVATALVLIAGIPLLAWPSWPARIAGVALVALVAASAVTRRILPSLADTGTYLAALLIYLNLVFASAQSLAGVIPTAASLRHLARLASAGYYEHNYAPPVPGGRGLELIAAAGIGAVAILTDVLAVRLRSPAVAGLPLLVLFAVPVATAARHSGVGLTIAFCLGITGYLALLSADGRERLRLWGRLVTVWQDDPDDEHGRGPDTRALAASGRRIGLAAVAVAVVVPLALPGLQRHGLFSGGGSGSGGITLVSPPAPLVQMSRQLLSHTPEPALSYRTNAADPPEQYLQVYVLNYDNGSDKWTLTDRSPSTAVGVQPMRAAPGLSTAIATTTDTTRITIDKAGGYAGGMSFLPLPYAPQYVTLPNNGWQETNSTLMVYGYHPDAGLSYSVTSKTAVPTPAQLSSQALIPADIKRGGYLSYTSPDRARLAGIARQITSRAHGRYAQALALEDYFTESGLFTYALRGNLPTSLVQFLTTDRIGYCQQFAFAMAVLARLTGIPSRVAVGYTAGTRAAHGLWKVTTADAHAWPELYFAGVGWIRFEPTPGGPAAQGTATRPVYSAVTPGSITPQRNQPGFPPVLAPVAGGQNVLAPKNRKPEGGGGTTVGHGAARKGGFPVGLLLLAILAALLVAPGLARVVTRRRRWLTAGDGAARAHAAWRELTSDLVDHGLGGAASESPRALAARLAGTGTLGEAAQQGAGRIAAAEERARYARTPGPADSLKSDGQLVRRALARNARLAERWRARLLPASTLAPVIAAARQAPDVFGWLDVAGLRIRRAVGGAVHARRAN
jgi:transglutaminase-like putative cysteine protease